MKDFQSFEQTLTWLLPVLILVAVWEAVWKLIALWKAGRNNELAWFICIALLNTAGILPIIYLIRLKKKANLSS